MSVSRIPGSIPRCVSFPAALLFMFLVPVLSASGQQPEPPPPQGRVRVFLDMQIFYVDFDHLRREVPFVDWVRQPQDADVHILMASQPAGSGGMALTLTFIGRERFADRTDTLTAFTDRDATESEARDVFTRTLKLGLMPFVARTPEAERIRVLYQGPRPGEVETSEETDPWNLWVFRMRVGGNFNGETRQSRSSYNGSLSANRTTEAFKFSFSAYSSYSRSEFELDETTTFVNTSRSGHANASVVWSLGPHWSAGVRGGMSRSTFLNKRLEATLAPAVEYNIFPWEQSARRELTVTYHAGYEHNDYEEQTILLKEHEMLPEHGLSISASLTEPWGSVNGSLNFSQYLHDTRYNSASLFSSLDIRLFKGLSLNLFGNISRPRDQIYLSGAGLSPEEILLQRRQLKTDWTWFGNLGISYSFGSKFNNAVNPRLWF